MVLQMWEFIKFLGMIIIILILIGIIFAIADGIYSHIKMSIYKRIAMKKLAEALHEAGAGDIVIQKHDDNEEKDVN